MIVRTSRTLHAKAPQAELHPLFLQCDGHGPAATSNPHAAKLFGMLSVMNDMTGFIRVRSQAEPCHCAWRKQWKSCRAAWCGGAMV